MDINVNSFGAENEYMVSGMFQNTLVVSHWVSVTTLRDFSVLYDSHIFLFQALKLTCSVLYFE